MLSQWIQTRVVWPALERSVIQAPLKSNLLLVETFPAVHFYAHNAPVLSILLYNIYGKHLRRTSDDQVQAQDISLTPPSLADESHVATLLRSYSLLQFLITTPSSQVDYVWLCWEARMLFCVEFEGQASLHESACMWSEDMMQFVCWCRAGSFAFITNDTSRMHHLSREGCPRINQE